MQLTPELCAAARALAKINLADLAARTGLSVDALTDFESGLAVFSDEQRHTLFHTLESLGILFLPEEQDAGIGLRLKFDRDETARIIDWETEGGSAGEDEVA